MLEMFYVAITLFLAVEEKYFTLLLLLEGTLDPGQVTGLKNGAISCCHQQGAFISCQLTGSLDVKNDDAALSK